MSNQLNYIGKLNRQQKLNYKKHLLNHNKSICTGILCRGEVKPLNKFPKHGDFDKCYECYEIIVTHRQSLKIREYRNKIKLDRQQNKKILKKWKELNFEHKKIEFINFN